MADIIRQVYLDRGLCDIATDLEVPDPTRIKMQGTPQPEEYWHRIYYSNVAGTGGFYINFQLSVEGVVVIHRKDRLRLIEDLWNKWTTHAVYLEVRMVDTGETEDLGAGEVPIYEYYPSKFIGKAWSIDTARPNVAWHDVDVTYRDSGSVVHYLGKIYPRIPGSTFGHDIMVPPKLSSVSGSFTPVYAGFRGKNHASYHVEFYRNSMSGYVLGETVRKEIGYNRSVGCFMGVPRDKT